MSSPNVAPRPMAIPRSAEFVPSLPGSLSTSLSKSHSKSHSRSHSLRHHHAHGNPSNLPFSSPKSHHSSSRSSSNTNGLYYSFINSDFIDDGLTNNTLGTAAHGPGTAPPANMGLPAGNGASVASFRNLTSTPRSSHPLSLPKSLPIDWNLFNKQFELQQRRKLARLKRKLGDELENNFENLPYPVIDFIADCVESQNDLINLSQTCKFFNKMLNKRLYSKIILVDNISEKCMHYDGDYTLVDAKNYPKLLATLHSNKDLIQLIKEIIIDTSSNNSSYDSLAENIYSALYDLFLTTNNNLRVLENLDFSNLKKFNSLLRYNKDHLIKHNYNKYTYFYSNSENMDDLIRNDLLHLKNFQILDLNDLNSLPLSTTSISLVMEHEFQLHDTFQLQYSGSIILQNLTTLKLHTAVAFERFVNEMYQVFNDASTRSRLMISRLSNIKTLSIANLHRVDDHQHSSRLSFEKLNTIIDLSQLQNLEIKTSCLQRDQCNSCVLQFMVEWYNAFNVYEKSNLKKLSIISLPPNINKNVNVQWDSILDNLDFLKKLGENLEFFFINLNDFPFVPMFEKTLALEVQDHQKLPINKEILNVHKRMYSNLLDSFQKLEHFIIPDYFYNWSVYNNIPDLTKDENLNYLNFLDTCQCSTCCQSRALFKKYSSQHQFKDFQGRFQTALQYGTVQGSDANGQTVNRYNKLNDNPDKYRILYNYILRELKSRIPLKQLNKVQSSLDYDTFVPNVNSQCLVISQSDFAQFTKLFAHGLRPDIQRLIDTLPRLKKFNLGGMLFKCYDVGMQQVRVHAVYDEFDEMFVRK